MKKLFFIIILLMFPLMVNAYEEKAIDTVDNYMISNEVSIIENCNNMSEIATDIKEDKTTLTDYVLSAYNDEFITIMTYFLIISLVILEAYVLKRCIQ